MRASNDRLVHVTDVQNGLDCGCLCPDCGAPLIARQGKSRVWHFAHLPDEDCGSAGETALHLAAKQTLKDLNGQISIPEEVIRKTGWPTPNEWASKPMAKLNDLMTYIIPERHASESNVRIEPQDWADQGFRPDAVMEKDGHALLIEIRVTHRVDVEKQRRMQKVGLGVIEINLSETNRNTTLGELERLLVSDAPRIWLVTGRKETRKKWDARFTKRLKNEASRFNKMFPRELTRNLYVNACPRRNEPGFEMVGVYQCLDCEFCGGRLGDYRGTPLWNMLDDYKMHADENSVLCAHRGGSDNLPTERQKGFVLELARSDLEREGDLTPCLPNGWRKDRAFCSDFISAHPDCSICNRKMALRRNHFEHFFWGCSDYPSCRGTSSYSPKPPLQAIVALHERNRIKEQQENVKFASERAVLARPEAGQNSLSELAVPLLRRPSKG